MPTDNDDQVVDFRASGLSKTFLKLLAERQEYSQIKRNAEAEEKKRSQTLCTMLAEAGHKTVVTPDWRVTFVEGVHTQISKQKLLDQGVSVKVIQKATTRTTYETVNVTVNK